MPFPEDKSDLKNLQIVFATAQGKVRKNSLEDFTSINTGGKIAMKLDSNDKIVGVEICKDDQDIMLSTKKGKCIRFESKKLRVFKGRSSKGIKGINLAPNDEIVSLSIIITLDAQSENNTLGNKTDIKILDKISSKNELVNLLNGEEFIYKDLAIKSMKCTNSEFDDNPEIKAYIQVRDLTKNDNDKVYVFNGWMFSSSPSIAPFDHPVYDIWLLDCY